MCLSPAGFVISLVRNLLLGLNPENFLKFEIFHGGSSSPHRATETGYFKKLPGKDEILDTGTAGPCSGVVNFQKYGNCLFRPRREILGLRVSSLHH